MNHTILKQVRKRSGRAVHFDQSKIANAIFKAAQAVGGADRRADPTAPGQRSHHDSGAGGAGPQGRV